MHASQALALRALLEGQDVAALATLHDGEPAVSMVPCALLPQGQGFVIHVSRLATHTADMLAHPAVGLLVVAAADPAVSPQARPRVSIQGRAQRCAPSDPLHAEARARYLARFPQSEEMFSFADFSLFIVTVRSARFIGGFAQAVSVAADAFADIMADAGAAADAATPPGSVA